MNGASTRSRGFLGSAAAAAVALAVVAVLHGEALAQGGETGRVEPIPVPNPASELWREVRSRAAPDAQDPQMRGVAPRVLFRDLWTEVQSGQTDIAGRTQVAGIDSGVLINTRGEQWRNFRVEQLVPFAGYLLGGILLLIAVFWGFRGTIRIGAGRSGVKLRRFSSAQRVTHWTVAISFLTLGLTGVVLLLGRFMLIPVVGAEAFGVIALASKRIHDFIGPLFGVALAVQFVLFVRGNLPHPRDVTWIAKGGGLLGGHASAHRYNAGEKVWFWLAMLGGAAVVVSGLVLDFPIFDQNRHVMELNHMIHSLAAVVVLAASFGHIYMGTLGTEGTFEIMKTGYCDVNWAKEHHDLWYEDMKAQGRIGATEGEDDARAVETRGAVGGET